jgi:hypothetical protein
MTYEKFLNLDARQRLEHNLKIFAKAEYDSENNPINLQKFNNRAESWQNIITLNPDLIGTLYRVKPGPPPANWIAFSQLTPQERLNYNVSILDSAVVNNKDGSFENIIIWDTNQDKWVDSNIYIADYYLDIVNDYLDIYVNFFKI